MFSGFLDAASHRDNDLGRAQIHRALRFAEEFERLGADLARRRSAARTSRPPPIPAATWSARKAPACKDAKCGAAAGRSGHRVHLALEELAHQHHLAVFDTVGDHVAHRTRPSAVASFGSEIAHLVGMRKQHELGFACAINCRSAERIRIRRVVLQQVVLDRVDFSSCLRASSRGQRLDALPQTAAQAGGVEFRAPTAAPPPGSRTTCGSSCAAALFHDDQNAHKTRASNFSFSTSLAAASLALAFEELRLLGALRQVHALELDATARSAAGPVRRRRAA